MTGLYRMIACRSLLLLGEPLARGLRGPEPGAERSRP